MSAPPAPAPGREAARPGVPAVAGARGADARVALPPPRWLAAMALALLRRPTLLPAALRQAWRLAPSGWWRRSPHLPLPAAAYVAFRSQTMYGNADRLPDPADVCTYLHWCRAFPTGQG